VSQVQVLQAFFTLIGASLVAGEKLRPDIWIFCFAVVAMVALGRRMAVGSIYREKE
jgi:drug/metabolite transporter (DMT)-like permease